MKLIEYHWIGFYVATFYQGLGPNNKIKKNLIITKNLKWIKCDYYIKFDVPELVWEPKTAIIWRT